MLGLAQQRFADRQQTEDRFKQMLAESREQRKTFMVALQKQNQRFEAWEQRWEEEHKEQNRKREANQEELNRLHEEVMAMVQRHDRTVAALGARWGTSSEAAFRNALAGILEDSFGVQVLNVNEHDDEGVVFGNPDQVELDVIIANGTLILCELKSSLSKADL